ncbi:MAG: PQQ-dependent sugar dehydrogenase, partial [Gammaproteobacteria bacterium]|nr:PQQ-dependent sugar dehydrogenase [Gammaproteobacteria bacterium]
MSRVVFLFGLGLLQSACGGSSGGNFSPPPPPPPPPPPAPPAIAIERVFDQVAFASPVAFLQAPGDASRWFVVEQAGIVRAFDDDPNVQAANVDVYVDIRGRVTSGGERGLLGMAFHPDFATNGRVYLSYTGGAPLTSFVSRFTVDAGTGNLDPNSESIVISVPQESTNHNGGQIAFGPDGYLYFALGDGGGAGDPNERAQDTIYLLGSILRLDVDGAAPYAIPADNPFATNTNCVGGSGAMSCPEIFAWGFRNPWRFSFDRQSGDLWVGDVGQGAWEEIDRVELGLNYGWDEREGAHCFEPPAGCSMNNVDPITEYANAGDNISVTGGYVYRGAAIPDLAGFYLFSDFGSGRIWAVPSSSAQGTGPDELLDTALSVSSFGEGAD